MKDMVNEMSELDEEFQNKLAEKKSLHGELREYEKEIDALNQKKMQIWKKLREMNTYFKKTCTHNWKREAYIYSPLFCTICGVERP